MSFKMNEQELDRVLYKFHRMIYYFELNEKKSFGYDWKDLYLLRLINENNYYKMKDLSQHLKIEKFQLTRLVTKLESNKLLYRSKKEDDHKSVYLNITTLGKEVINKTKHRHYQLFKESLGNMDDEELKIITSFIDSLDELILPNNLEGEIKRIGDIKNEKS